MDMLTTAKLMHLLLKAQITYARAKVFLRAFEQYAAERDLSRGVALDHLLSQNRRDGARFVVDAEGTFESRSNISLSPQAAAAIEWARKGKNATWLDRWLAENPARR
jgi:hypothetical protein